MPEPQAAGGAGPDDRLVERGPELRLIRDALERAGAGQGSLVLVRGPAGIGKTAILRATRGLASSVGRFTVQAHAGSPLEAEQAFAAMVGLLGAPVFARLSAGRDRFRGASELALPLFETGHAGRHGEFPIVHGLHWMCVTLCEESPLLLVLDDAQWVDAPSLRALTYLADRLADLPVLLLVAARTGEGRHEAALAELSRRAAATIGPPPLSTSAVATLVRGAPATLPDPELSQLSATIAERSGGIPFFVRALIDLHRTDPTVDLESATPESIVEAMTHRLAALAPAIRGLAVASAVLGDRAHVAEIAAVAGVDVRSAAAGLDELYGAELLADGETATFRHPLLRDAVLAGEPARRRLELAVRAARATHAAHPVRAARHLVDSSELAPVEEPWVVPTLERAAAYAAGRGGSEEATSYLGRALEEDLDEQQALRIHHRLGMLLGDLKDLRALDHLGRARTLATEPAAAADVALSHADALFHLALLEESALVARQALDELPESSVPERRLALEATALNAEALVGINRDRPGQLADNILGGDTPGQRALLTHIAWDLAARGSQDHLRVVDLGRRAVGSTLLTEEVGPASPLFVYAGTALAWAGDYSTARDHAETGIRLAVRRGSLVGLAYATSLRAGIAVLQGDVHQAEAHARRVLDELAEADPMCFAVTVGWEIEVAIELEQPDRARALLAETELDGDVLDYGTLDLMLLARARLYAELSDDDRALVELEEVARRSERSLYVNPSCSPWRSMSARLLAARGEHAVARELALAELSDAERFGAPRPIGVALRSLAATRTDPDEAAGDLRRAVDVLSGSGAALQHAEALVELGSVPAAGAVEDRRELLRAGMDLAHRCGSRRVVSTALAALRATGARPRRPAVHGIESLTAQERRVALLAVDGLANREIAEAMFVTRRTVELHLTNAYRKLGITTRAELTRQLQR